MLDNTESVEYYLANGGTVSYSYSPGSSIFNLIQEIADQYSNQCAPAWPPDVVFLRPDAWTLLNKQMVASAHTGWGMSPIHTDIRIYTSAGNLLVKPKYKLTWPIFYGTPSELENSDFTKLFNEVLK